MTLSIWRYSHLTLAVSSFLFVIVASVTGLILAFEPISKQLEPYAISDLSSTSIALTVEKLQENYDEVIAIEIDNENYVTASVVTKDGKSEIFYIDPKSGEKLGNIIEKSTVFRFATNLHRSLFLKSIGRFFVGLVSFLLFLITVSGIGLILKRQGGIRNFFVKITNENFYQYAHVVLGRWSLLPLILITLTGVYLSLEKFNLLPKVTVTHELNFETFAASPKRTFSDFTVFKNTPLSEVKKLEFPFSSDIEDYFILQLKDKELTINQITGDVLSEVNYPFTTLASYYSLIVHTGQGSVLWSIVLALASLAALFFIVSGFKMTLERLKGQIKNKYRRDECEYIILVGSENGSTKRFAKMLYKGFLKEKKKVFVSHLNGYTTFKSMKHLVVLTATYGEGEPPSNASKFLTLIKREGINTQPFFFSVVAFGSLAYPKYCQFGIDVNRALKHQTSAKELLPICTINNKSFEAFSKWCSGFCSKTDVSLTLDKSIMTKRKKTVTLSVTSRKEVQGNDTFLLEFKADKYKFTSGDLLWVYPNAEAYERLYSIARVGERLLLSVKRHHLGVCSNYLYNLEEEQAVNAYIQHNPSFHFPKQATKVIMIATGTGIAPFLGMIDKAAIKPIDLYFGITDKAALELYKEVLKLEHVSNYYLAFSREQNTTKTYVQDIIKTHIDAIILDLESSAVIMICGAIAMQNAVFDVLEHELKKKNQSLSFYKKAGQILVDCY